MKHFAGLDVSVKETTICIVDAVGAIVKEVTVVTEPDAIIEKLQAEKLALERVGLEADSKWLVNPLSEAGLPVIFAETRHMTAVLKAG